MRAFTAAVGVLAGLVAIGTAVYMKSTQPIVGLPWDVPGWLGWLAELGAFNAIGWLGGMGLLMIVGGLVSLRSPAIGGILIVVPAVLGLVYVYTHEWYRVDLLYFWAAPVLLCWLAGILAGYAVHDETEALG
jgi:hypothetical protein